MGIGGINNYSTSGDYNSYHNDYKSVSDYENAIENYRNEYKNILNDNTKSDSEKLNGLRDLLDRSKELERLQEIPLCLA